MTIVHNLRQHNRERVVRLLYTGDSLSRPDIATALGLSKVTTTSIVNALIEEGWVTETAKTENGTGRPAGLVELHPEAGTVAGLDIQVNSLGIISGNLTATQQTSLETRAVKQSRDSTRAIIEALERLRFEQPHGPLRQVVIAVPAPVTLGGELSAPNRLPELGGERLRTWSAEAGVSLSFENDVNLAAVTEYHQGAGQGCENFALLSERDGGVALGLFLDGQLYRGARGQAGELALIGWPHGRGLRSIEALPLEVRELALAQVCSAVAIALDLDLFLVHQHPGGAAALNVSDRVRDFVLRPLTVTSSRYGDEGPVRGALLQAAHLAREQLFSSL